MQPFVDGLRARGIEATAIDLPKRKAEEAIPAFHKVVPSAPDVVVGGHSYGGRVASLAAAEPDAPYAALVLLSFPLHPPGSPDRTEARTAHFASIRCPVLFLSGESDPFARIGLLRAAVKRIGGPVRARDVSEARAWRAAGPRRRARPGRRVPRWTKGRLRPPSSERVSERPSPRSRSSSRRRGRSHRPWHVSAARSGRTGGTRCSSPRSRRSRAGTRCI